MFFQLVFDVSREFNFRSYGMFIKSRDYPTGEEIRVSGPPCISPPNSRKRNGPYNLFVFGR